MKLKNLVTLVLFLTCLNSHNTFCQYFEFTAKESKVFSQPEMDSLINTTTLFLLRDQDMSNKMEFKRAIDSVWNFTKIEVIGYNELEAYQEGNYSYFILQAFSTLPHETVNNVANVFLTLKLEPVNYWETLNYCRIELFTDINTMSTIIDIVGGPSSLDSLYKESTLKNWNPELISLYLSDVQRSLRSSKRESLYELNLKNDALQLLTKNDTLYILDYVQFKYNKFNGDERERHDIDVLFKHCPMTVQFITSSNLRKKMNHNQVKYIFDYVKSCTDKFVRIYSLEHGKIYQVHKGLSYNLKPKDIKKIFK
jgi:hypothetical protein